MGMHMIIRGRNFRPYVFNCISSLCLSVLEELECLQCIINLSPFGLLLVYVAKQLLTLFRAFQFLNAKFIIPSSPVHYCGFLVLLVVRLRRS